MMVFGVDYAQTASKAAVKAMLSHGVEFVCRYFSHTKAKNLTPDEASALTAAGLWIVSVWETSADRALDGRAAGIEDAKDALAQARACGMPDDRPIFFAVDFDAQPGEQDTINNYLAGAASVLGRARVGIYGGYGPVARAMAGGHAAWGWQTYAWSGGRWYGPAHLQQYSNDHIIGGIGLDYDRSTADDFGQWKAGISPAPAQEDDMLFGDLYNGASEVTPISWPTGKCRAIGFFADTGLAGGAVTKLRVAYHKGGGVYVVKHVEVDSSKGKTVVSFGADAATVDAVSVQREGNDEVSIGWDAS